jgi:hypothetical protein
MPDLAVHAPDGPGNTLHAVLRGGRHALVMSNRAAGPADRVDLRPYRDLVALVTAPLRHRRTIALIRPDGYLAAVGTADDTTAIRDYLQHLAATRSPPGRLCADADLDDGGVVGGEDVGAGKGPAGGVPAGPWCACWRSGGQSDVTSAAAARALDSSTMALRPA